MKVATAITIHVLDQGSTLCGAYVGQTPNKWPSDQHWVSKDDAGHANCVECLRIVDQSS